ncbi:HalOD1 output domain-containing protein [Halomarina pelagica]|uniref:HalOD1 output domain-containing protein n=1 Tax=Halomarina pelagica TaxID=2961599 RepID=UPI0034A5C7DD
MPESNRRGEDGPTSDTRGAIQAEFDWSEVTPSTAVVEMVAIAANREPTVLEPRSETIDPDALDMLIRSMGGPIQQMVTRLLRSRSMATG